MTVVYGWARHAKEDGAANCAPVVLPLLERDDFFVCETDVPATDPEPIKQLRRRRGTGDELHESSDLLIRETRVGNKSEERPLAQLFGLFGDRLLDGHAEISGRGPQFVDGTRLL